MQIPGCLLKPQLRACAKALVCGRLKYAPTRAVLDAARAQRHFASWDIDPIPRNKIRNIAIIAHVDHGKTTLVDSLLQLNGHNIRVGARLLDQNDIERERGITILAKATRIQYNDNVFNIVDTPGHADFGGEVERVLSIVDGVVLVVDLIEGPMCQSRYVLSKALMNPKVVPIVFVNKVDCPYFKPKGSVENAIFEMFLSVGASDAQMEYPVLYGSAKHGWAERSWEAARARVEQQAATDTAGDSGGAPDPSMTPLCDMLINHVPPPAETDLPEEFTGNNAYRNDPAILHGNTPFARTRVTDDFRYHISFANVSGGEEGVWVTGKVESGVLTKDATLLVKSTDGTVVGRTTTRNVFVTEGVSRRNISVASPGDIVSLQISSSEGIKLRKSLVAHPSMPALQAREVDRPLIAVTVGPNTSPLQGQDCKLTTLQDLYGRLLKETFMNASIEVELTNSGKRVKVRGRGDLQLAILFETIRREGFEFEIASPEVICKVLPTGEKLEPWEKYSIIVPSQISAKVIERMVKRGADLDASNVRGNFMELEFICPTRAFFGMHIWLDDISKKTATVYNELVDYRPIKNMGHSIGKKYIIATHAGEATATQLQKFQSEGRFFIEANAPVYEGMILGKSNGDGDIVVNITRTKKATAITVRQKDQKCLMSPTIRTPIEFCLAYITEEDLIEVTPKRISMRKKILCNAERMKSKKKLNQLFMEE